MASHTAAQCVTRALGLDATLLSDAACMKLAISKVLGLGVVAGSALVKVPQIVKMINASSADGLSGTSITLEAVSNVAAVSYYAGLDFAFSTWGENIFLLLQNLAIAGLYLMYTRRLRSHGCAAAAAAARSPHVAHGLFGANSSSPHATGHSTCSSTSSSSSPSTPAPSPTSPSHPPRVNTSACARRARSRANGSRACCRSSSHSSRKSRRHAASVGRDCSRGKYAGSPWE